MARPSKRICVTDSDYEKTVHKCLNESDSDDASDISDADEDYFDESVHDTSSELSEESDEEPQLMEPSDDSGKYYYGKNRFRWCKTEVRPKSLFHKNNIVRNVRIPNTTLWNLGAKADPLSVWNLLITDDMLDQIVLWTNNKLKQIRNKCASPNKSDLKDIDLIELKAFIGILIYTSVFESNCANIDAIFATDGTGREIFRCVMNKKRFILLLSSLRFDNPEDRQERKKEDSTAPISEIFQKFINNCQEFYIMGSSACVDETLVSFRGKCGFKMCLPNKSCKYGIKVMCLTDARTGYLYNAYIYCGKDTDGFGLTPEERKSSKLTQSVLRLSKPLFGTNRNIIAGNKFSSIELAQMLLKNGLTYVGTLKRNKQEIPAAFMPNRKRPVGTTLYGFRKDLIIISHVEQKRKATVLISSMHDRIRHNPDTEKPEIIMYYNAFKRGVDALDKKCAESSSSRQTHRWSMAMFFRILDICNSNSYILLQCCKDNENIGEKSLFTKQLARQLVDNHLKRRSTNQHITRELRMAIHRILGIQETNTQEAENGTTLEKRKVCYLCPSKKRRMTKFLCINCRKAVCLQCSEKLCNDCVKNNEL